MYIIVVGASKIGEQIAKLLSQERHNVVVVEKNEDRATKVSEKLDVSVINGSGTEIDVLQDAGADRADVIFAATSDDAVNLMVCELARILEIERRITLGQNPKHEKIFREVGTEEIIFPSRTIATYIRNIITRPSVRSVMSTMKKDADIVEIVIPPGAIIAGKEVKHIGMPEGSTITAIYRDNELLIPRGDTVVEAGDKIIVLARNNIIEKVAELLTRR
ncbi:trk system potassium uptake protein TrkA [archaeon BMS3Bbin15]|nr:trk system potassium uptake protein TrkA [archaeon BMS3Bbin15]